MAVEKPDRNYDTGSLNKFFAIGSVILLIVVLAMVADDYSRQWKDFQRRFYRLEATRTEKEIQEAERALNSADMKRLRADLKKAEDEIQKQRDDYRKLERQLSSMDAEFYGRDLDYRFAKATYDSQRYDTEIEIDRLRREGKTEEAAAKQAALDTSKKKMDDAKVAFDEVTARQEAIKTKMAKINGKVDEIQTSINKTATARDRLQKKLDRVESSFVNWLVNSPMLDFMAPTLQVQQIVLPKLRHDINFMEVPRVDRCITCHTVIDKQGYETSPQPFRTHPNLKMYVQENSKHPMETFGCTACHGGRDRGTSFTNAAHTPDNDKQKKEWEEKYNWEKMHFWETPMRSRTHFYAGCYSCHSDQAALPDARPLDPKSTAGNLDRGLRTVEIAGCHGCHRIKGFEKLRKAGPDLTRISNKTTQDWAFRWIRNPRSFRSHARMPSFFLQSNQQDAAVADRPKASELNDAEIEGMVTYLWDKSEPLSYSAADGGGNPVTGRELVHSVGCRGCHTDDPKEAFPHRADPRAFGPNLFGMGSKVNQEWLFDWLKNPKHYWAETNMPILRLTDQVARDISAYLLSQRNAEFEKIQAPKVGNATRDWLTREYLSTRMPLSAAEAKLKSMSDSEKKLFLGERMINKYGCFGCHQIKGFENTQPIGTELTEEGSKHVDRLDFGLEEDSVEKTLPAWVSAKLKDPRRFDRGKIKTWDEKLKMPNFYFNNQEITDLVTVIQGFSKTRMDTDMRWTLSGERPAIEAGRRVIRDHNCVGCHIVGKQGGAIRTTIQDPGYFPPILDGEGEKVIPFWLFSFLKEPSTIRPWMTVRMPTFGLKDHETTAISRMFAALDNAEYPFETEYYRLEPVAPEVNAAGAKLFTDFKCLQCHIAGSGKPERDAADLAPNLSLARSRLRPLWIEKWLRNPEALQPGTRMPSYFPDMKSPDPATLGGDAAQQIRALRYHILGLSSKMSPVAAAATTGK